MEYLFTEENLKRILASSKRPSQRPSDCPVCARISSSLAAGSAEGDALPGLRPDAETSRLVEFIMVKNSWHILKCPLCSRLYTDEFRYDHLVGGRENDYSIADIDYADALELLKGIKAKKLTKSGTTWIITF